MHRYDKEASHMAAEIISFAFFIVCSISLGFIRKKSQLYKQWCGKDMYHTLLIVSRNHNSWKSFCGDWANSVFEYGVFWQTFMLLTMFECASCLTFVERTWTLCNYWMAVANLSRQSCKMNGLALAFRTTSSTTQINNNLSILPEGLYQLSDKSARTFKKKPRRRWHATTWVI